MWQIDILSVVIFTQLFHQKYPFRGLIIIIIIIIIITIIIITIIIIINSTGRGLLCPKFFICKWTTLLLQRTTQGKDFCAQTFLYV